ncbi:carboxylating nicotinate-nucleotide diphosphorylase [Amphibacillus sp. MSJ-3]|uniref:carboxylating nicotinate-nucleotide diphosphorylase n=1 Tax=Amphibacillus sp. MSJ-3 TaxID=2841505 RepID=UPI001C0F0DDB|nr:carboxylating nicotinate-nucleotide diphosphorylase [Amphibacillus sp. MSJ-3]MBU5593800.1 carboxylating nicotinate-nucleotide diphosphorylase [Amphibacillus sp. MSJ-3]
MNQVKLKRILENFFIEDLGEGDQTTDLIFPQGKQGKLVFLAKEAGIFCGKDIIQTGFLILNSGMDVNIVASDGDQVVPGQQLALVTGEITDLLKGERVILNLIQRMSGIATLTSKAVARLNNDQIRICDTRKTTPGLRMIEKYAVRCGGGYNHRFGLYDGVMIKDNHISFAGSIKRAVQFVRSQTGHMVKIEVETESKEQVIEAVEAGADIIMFDNCPPDQIAQLIKLVPDSIITEASGGIDMENLALFRETGVDYISLGFLTHSYHALDISAEVLLDK